MKRISPIFFIIVGLSAAIVSRVDIPLGAGSLRLDGAPAVAMIHNSPVIIIGSTDDSLYGINCDGSTADGFPYCVGGPINSKIAWEPIDSGIAIFALTADGTLWRIDWDGSIIDSVFAVKLGTKADYISPVLFDIDEDDELDVLLTVDTTLYVYSFDGSEKLRIEFNSSVGVAVATPVAGDIDSIPGPEIIVESYDAIYAFHNDGTTVDSFPISMPEHNYLSYSTPLLWDFDEDGVMELFFASHFSGFSSENGTIYSYDNDSGLILLRIVGGIGSWIYGPPAMGDVNGDYTWDLAFGTVTSLVLGINGSGALTSFGGWTINLALGHIYGSMLMMDINGEPGPEYIFQSFQEDSLRSFLVAVDYKQSDIEGFPDTLETDRSGLLSPVAFEHESTIYIAAADGDGNLRIWSLPGAPLPGYKNWTEYLGNRRNSNVAPPNPAKLTIVNISDNDYKISWSPSDYPEFANYKLFLSPDSTGTTFTHLTTIDDISETTFQFTSEASIESIWIFSTIEDIFGRSSIRSKPVHFVDTSSIAINLSEEIFSPIVIANPLNSTFKLNAPVGSIAQIVNIRGSVVEEISIVENPTSIEMNRSPAGVYLVNIFSNSGRKICTSKMILIK